MGGAQLVGYFDEIGAEFGSTGRMKLAMLTAGQFGERQ